MQEYDLIVVGGGCNGTGIARDAAMRGMRVLLLEKNDFAAGTTGASSGMIHGGPRYLQYEVGTTKLACEDAAHIRHIAPHLCFRIPFLVPILQDSDPLWFAKLRLETVEAFFEAYDRFSPLKGGKKHTRLSKEESRQLEPMLVDDVIGSVTFDEWGIDTNRLCLLNALAAQEYGATVKNHTRVTEIFQEPVDHGAKKIKRRITGVRTENVLTGEGETFGCRALFNATGPWGPQLAALAGVHYRLRPGKGIHLLVDRRLTNMAIVAKCIDGRQIFINPHENNTLIGTTDDDYFGDPDDIPVTEDEVEYLLEGIATVCPDIRKARIISTWRGLRPTLYERDVYEDDLSRGHKVLDHEKSDGVFGMFSMLGGKLASYRVMSEEAVDLVATKLGNRASCQTQRVPLPGGESMPEAAALAAEFEVPEYAVRRLVFRHGARASEVLELTRENPRFKNIVCPCEPVIEAEIRYAIRNEWAVTGMDLLRRCKVGAGACQGELCAARACQILAEETGVAALEIRSLLRNFLEETWRARSAILTGDQVVQEEMLQWTFQGVMGMRGAS